MGQESRLRRFFCTGPYESSNTDISAIELDDFDGDGDHDIFYATQGNGVVNILKNQESDGFVAQQVDSGTHRNKRF